MRLVRRPWTVGGWGLVLAFTLVGCADPEPRFEGLPASHWLGQIKSANKAERWRAAIALGELGPGVPGGVRALAEATKDPESSVRFHAVQALSRLGPAAAPAADELRERLQDSTPQTRDLARRTLDQIEKGTTSTAKSGAPAPG
jgi:HEAT repeat protein